MDIKTKFNFFDKVREISFERDRVWTKCSFCDGEKNINGADGSSAICPECHGHGSRWMDEDKKWSLGESLTIGQIRTEETAESNGLDENSMFSNYGPQRHKYIEQYMCYETGIGTGTLHNHYNLFATDEEAQAECDRRNAEGTKPEQITVCYEGGR